MHITGPAVNTLQVAGWNSDFDIGTVVGGCGVGTAASFTTESFVPYFPKGRWERFFFRIYSLRGVNLRGSNFTMTPGFCRSHQLCPR